VSHNNRRHCEPSCKPSPRNHPPRSHAAACVRTATSTPTQPLTGASACGGRAGFSRAGYARCCPVQVCENSESLSDSGHCFLRSALGAAKVCARAYA
jgi:hypothetical protein